MYRDSLQKAVSWHNSTDNQGNDTSNLRCEDYTLQKSAIDRFKRICYNPVIMDIIQNDGNCFFYFVMQFASSRDSVAIIATRLYDRRVEVRLPVGARGFIFHTAS